MNVTYLTKDLFKSKSFELNHFNYDSESHYMGLDFESDSAESKGLIDCIFDEISLRKLNINSDGNHLNDAKMKVAVEAICLDLLVAKSHNPKGWAYRSIRKEAFTGERVGYRPFEGALNALLTLGYVEKTRSKNNPIIGGWDNKAPRMRLTEKFMVLAKDCGVDPSDPSHFRVADFIPKPSKPIRLRPTRTEKWSKKSDKEKEKAREKAPDRGCSDWKRVKAQTADLKVDYDIPSVKQYVKQMEEINAFLGEHRLTLAGDPHGIPRCRGLQRIFNHGDMDGHDYQQGGRLYAISGGYQGFAGRPPKPGKEKRPERKDLLIDNEQTVEIDIGGSHTRILFAKLGHPLAEDEDPYKFDFPRFVAKRFFTMFLGNGDFQTKWSPEVGRDFNDEIDPSRKIGKAYPIKMVREAVLAKYPFLADWPTCPIRWADLHYTEAQIIAETVHRLAMEHGIPAYPVHDSIIVPVSKIELAKQVLREVFKEQVGEYPALSVKGA